MRALIAALMIAFATAALAKVMTTQPFTGPIGGGSGVFPGGAEIGITGAATGSGASPPPAGCTGTIDLTEGCPMPMLGM